MWVTIWRRGSGCPIRLALRPDPTPVPWRAGRSPCRSADFDGRRRWNRSTTTRSSTAAHPRRINWSACAYRPRRSVPREHCRLSRTRRCCPKPGVLATRRVCPNAVLLNGRRADQLAPASVNLRVAAVSAMFAALAVVDALCAKPNQSDRLALDVWCLDVWCLDVEVHPVLGCLRFGDALQEQLRAVPLTQVEGDRNRQSRRWCSRALRTRTGPAVRDRRSRVRDRSAGPGGHSSSSVVEGRRAAAGELEQRRGALHFGAFDPVGAIETRALHADEAGEEASASFDAVGVQGGDHGAPGTSMASFRRTLLGTRHGRSRAARRWLAI